MTPHHLFLNQPKQFWAYVRSISQQVRYTVRGSGQIKVPSLKEMTNALKGLSLDPSRVVDADGNATELGSTLSQYFEYRAAVLNHFVQPRLMNVARARALFLELQAASKYTWPVPMNKQKGEKKAPAYLTAIVNMLIETNAEGMDCDPDPRASAAGWQMGI